MRERLLELIAAGDFKTFLIEFYHAVGSDALDTFSEYHIFESVGLMYHSNSLEAGDLTLTLVDQHGGGEGEGEYVERNYRINDGDQVLAHVQITGFYTSNDGTEWNHEVTRVYPKEVSVVKYFTTL